MLTELLLDPDQLEPLICRKLRSKLPQRRRSTFNSNVSGVSYALSSFGGEVSVGRDTSTVSQSSGAVSSARKRRLVELGDSDRGFNKESRFCSSLKDNEFGNNVDISETSCCESSIVADFGERGSMLLGASTGFRNSKAVGRSEASQSIARSGISSTHQNSPEKSVEFSSKLCSGVSNVEENRKMVDCDDDVVSVTSAVESRKKTDKATHRPGNKDRKIELSLTSANKMPTVDEKLKIHNHDSELACSEQLSDNDVSDYSSSQEESFSDLQSEIFADSSDYFSYSSLESGSEFSEKSFEDAPPSATFSLLLLYRGQFFRSSNYPRVKRTNTTDINEYTIEGFDDEEDAESYRLLRSRERNQVYLRNYGEEYSASIIEQRSRMIYWIIEQSRAKMLVKETTFLAANLLDRFFSIGYFRNKRNIQVAGIACLTLAKRIEENQPYNSVRQNTFHMGSNSYSRFEVVAMEWLVQEVLNFQCVLPTSYNFLWFYLKASKADDKVKKRAIELAALALMDHEHLDFWPSTVAAAIVILASLEDAPCQRVIKTHVRTKDDDLPKCIESLQWLVKYLC